MQNLTIKSITKNRIRLKSPDFKQPLEDDFDELIKKGAQIRQNAKCASIIVTYSEKNLSANEIIEAFQTKFEKEIYENTQSKTIQRKNGNYQPGTGIATQQKSKPCSITRAINAIFSNKILLIIIIILIVIWLFKTRKFRKLFNFIKKVQSIRKNIVEFKKVEKMIAEHLIESFLHNLKQDDYHVVDDNDYYKFISHHDD